MFWTFCLSEVASDRLKKIKKKLNEEKVSKIKLQMPKHHSEMHHLHSNNENPTKLDNSSIESAVKSKYSLVFLFGYLENFKDT